VADNRTLLHVVILLVTQQPWRCSQWNNRSDNFFSNRSSNCSSSSYISGTDITNIWALSFDDVSTWPDSSLSKHLRRI
ncbi:hypothetical protein A2U01_0084426, partial [Trifolium medium]|nr:hypothetical protein [Trifolium medium]